MNFSFVIFSAKPLSPFAFTASAKIRIKIIMGNFPIGSEKRTNVILGIRFAIATSHNNFYGECPQVAMTITLYDSRYLEMTIRCWAGVLCIYSMLSSPGSILVAADPVPIQAEAQRKIRASGSKLTVLVIDPCARTHTKTEYVSGFARADGTFVLIYKI